MSTEREQEVQRFNARKEAENPPHSRTSYVPIYTPPDVRIGLTLMPARYFVRGIFHSLTDGITPQWLKKYTTQGIVDRYAGKTKARIDAILHATNNDAVLQEELHHIHREAAGNSDRLQGLISKLFTEGKGVEYFKEIKRELSGWDKADKIHNLLHHTFDPNVGFQNGEATLTEQSYNHIRSGVNGRLFDYFYDTSLGIGAVAMDATLTRRAVNDINNIYRESVAYEMGKSPQDVTFKDIMHSPNEIIQTTRATFERKSWQRALTDAVFFLRFPFKWLCASEIAIGAKGILWMHDVLGRKPTMLESFIYFINDKLNPEFGLGDTIKKSEIIDFYQQYSFLLKPEFAFHSVLGNNGREANIWAQAEPIFERIAELMNLTYNYKHTTELDPITGDALQSADYPLPKFIYMLGHGLINAHEPAKTLAMVEIANTYDMEALKEVEHALKHGSSLQSQLDKYPVDLSILKRQEPTVSLSEKSTQKKSETHAPDTKVSHISTNQALAQLPTQDVRVTL